MQTPRLQSLPKRPQRIPCKQKESTSMASLLERVYSGPQSGGRRKVWKSTPRTMRLCFYSAVFLLFASASVLDSLRHTIYLSPIQIFLNIVIVGGFAVAYAAF